MDDVLPTSSNTPQVIVDDEYNIPRNVINPQLVKEAREVNRDSQRDSSVLTTVPSTSSPTHRPLLLPTTKGSSKVPQITISLSPPTEETNGELVQRELFRSHKPANKGWKGTTLIASLIALVVLLTLIFVLLLFQHM